MDFHGWQMPINYGSQIEEHNAVRNSCGIFDVSHMVFIDIKGDESLKFIKYLLANDVAALKEECDALYTPMLNALGGILDDLIIYLMPFGYRMVMNCATKEKDINWIKKNAQGFQVNIIERNDLSMIAIQGPKWEEIISKCLDKEICLRIKEKKSFEGILSNEMLIAKTGYTGEKGIEVLAPTEDILVLWTKALNASAIPIGLGARDTLRLEAGMNLYGFEMNETTSPLECNMSWCVSLKDKNRDFIGKNSYIMMKNLNNFSVLKGIAVNDKVIIRNGQEIFLEDSDKSIGIVTSGSFSPTLQKSIALVRVPQSASGSCYAVIRGKKVKGVLGKPKFVKEGKSIF